MKVKLLNNIKTKVELLKIRKEGSRFLRSEEYTYVLSLPRGKRLNVGDPVIGIYGISEIESIYEKDPFESYIYRLKEGSELVNPRKIVAFEKDLDPNFIEKEKDLIGPFYIEINNNQVRSELGIIKIFK